MKCPKCQYIGFDNGDRCRNCGYEFSLAVAVETDDLRIQTGDEALGPLADFALGNPASAAPSRPPALDDAARPAGKRQTTSALDLPLFTGSGDDVPLVTPSVPRPPLAVRRASPAPPKPQPRRTADAPPLDLDPVQEFEPEAPVARAAPRRAQIERNAEPDEPLVPAPGGARLAAAAIDAGFMGAIDGVVVYFTLLALRLSGVSDPALSALPAAPIVAFLLLLNGGYAVCFTVAGGQTIGKMLMGIRVVPYAPDAGWTGGVPLDRAILRTAGYLVSILPAGLGYLPAFLGAEHRAVHDRIADTRVVKA